MSEAQLLSEIELAIGSRQDCRIFRNNQGMAWTGIMKARYNNGDILLGVARPLRVGLITGAADLVGWCSEIIGPSHVGQRVGRFLSIEVKTPTGKLSDAQEIWRRNVRKYGGNAMVARSVSDAIQHLHDNPTGLETL